MRTTLCQYFIISLLMSLSGTGHGQGYDSAGYLLFLQKGRLYKEIREGDRIRLMIGNENDFSQFYMVKKITEKEVIYGPDLHVMPSQIKLIMKKNEVSTSILGAVLIVGGIALTAQAVRDINPFGDDGFALKFFSGIGVSAIGIALVIPPVFSKKKKHTIQIAESYRY